MIQREPDYSVTFPGCDEYSTSITLYGHFVTDDLSRSSRKYWVADDKGVMAEGN